MMSAANFAILREPARLDRQSRLLLWLMLGASTYLCARAIAPGVVPSVFDCPFHTFLGLNCLGCGMTRGCVHALSGRFIEAIQYNPLILLVLPFIAYWGASLLCTAMFRRKLVSAWPQAFVSGYQWAFIVLAVVLGMGRLFGWLFPSTEGVLLQLLIMPPGH